MVRTVPSHGTNSGSNPGRVMVVRSIGAWRIGNGIGSGIPLLAPGSRPSVATSALADGDVRLPEAVFEQVWFRADDEGRGSPRRLLEFPGAGLQASERPASGARILGPAGGGEGARETRTSGVEAG